ncbi:biotin synthase [Chromobacterium alkanivorans]|uniref:biotin synthase BioB n=1 Tax=Chromobacterium alkanivorans TaxID=1071719 RepID=UPI00216837F2|nr:biotin synthase BioB [Chromobacterium alkanivorans]MCS3805527.1 biotin synthase [Chromobacterium alkanivorans]MCS3819866.1 biotin synthase [Chromobacterium alkanivorans]MCS3874159.1 biotin synthase [Chromobacterium alkanivorans]
MHSSAIEFKPSATPHPESPSWTVAEIETLLALPFMELVFRAAEIHRQFFDPTKVQLSTLISIKTGGCPEDCGYCPQSTHHDTPVPNQPMLTVDEVLSAARAAKANGASRFCMGAAWRGPKDADLEKTLEMVKEVKALGLETCATFGLLKGGQAEKLKAAGLDYYNHNLDTSPDKYSDIIATRDYEDRLDTLGKVRSAGLSVCCGGIVGMNETRNDRAGLIAQLANLEPQPESVPINKLVKVEGTPLEGAAPLDWTEFVRTIAVARIVMPKTYVRLSAGRREMDESTQALCFLAGANSIFYGDKLLTTGNPEVDADRLLLEKLDLTPL